MSVKKVMLFSIIGFVITALVFGTVFYMAVYKKPNNQVKEIKTYSYSIGGLYSNIKDSKKILKSNIVIETTDEKIHEQIDSKKSQLTNDILELIRSKSDTDLSGDIGQKNLRKEILKLVKTLVPSEKIRDIYFVEFIIQ